MKNKKVLITGASVAGNTCAWWLSRQGFDVTVIEKAEGFRDGGQNVDVRGLARDVLKKMGLEDAARQLSIGEIGTDWVDEQNRTIARFAVEDIGDGPTSEMEIMRGDISRLIYEAASQKATYRFNQNITAIAQTPNEVQVTFADGKQESYDLVIVAEGVGSTTRELLFAGQNRMRYMNLTIAYFAIPGKPHDGQFARQYNTIGGRGATLKPGRDGKLRVYMGIYKKPEHENRLSVARQKQFIQQYFANDGWEFPRILEGMHQTDDFYFDVLRQVKLKNWNHGRVVLAGDAAWCATPLSGIGTTLAIVGPYLLAGELSKTDNYTQAFANYQKLMQPFVTEGQGTPQFVVSLLWPRSRFGLLFLRATMRLAGKPAIRKLFSKLFLRNSRQIQLPDYGMKAPSKSLEE